MTQAMNDTLTVKDLAMSAITGATIFPGASRTFARIASDDNSQKRLSAHISSISPTVLRIAHQPFKNGAGRQRSLMQLIQTLTRVDAQSNPVLVEDLKVSFNSDRTPTITLAEYRAAVSTFAGLLLQNDGELITAMYYGEQ